MTVKTRTQAMLYVFGKKIDGVFQVVELFNCWLVRYEKPKWSGKYHNEVYYKPNSEIENEIDQALEVLTFQKEGKEL